MISVVSRQQKETNTETEGRAILGLPYLGIHPICKHHCCCCQEALADRNLVWLLLGRSGQQLANAWSHRTELRDPVGELVEGLEEQKGIETP